MGRRWMNFMKEHEGLLDNIPGDEPLPPEIISAHGPLLEYFEEKVDKGEWSISENLGFLAGMCTRPIKLYKWNKKY